MNKKKLLITITIVAMLIIVILYFFFMARIIINKKNKDNENNKVKESESKQIETSLNSPNSKAPDKTDKNSNEQKSNNKHIVNENKQKKTLKKSEAEIIYLNSIKKASNFDFYEAYNYISTELSKYQQKKDSNLTQLEEDLALMANFLDMKKRGEETEAKEIIKNLQNSDAFFISTMWLEDSERMYLMKSTESLNPIFFGGVDILETKKVNSNSSKHLERINTKIDNIEEIIEYKFKIENNILLAYVIKNNNRFFLYKIVEEKEGTTPYYTINEWNEILN